VSSVRSPVHFRKTHATFAAALKLVKDGESGKWKAEYDFGDKVDLGAVELSGPIRDGRGIMRSRSSYVLRERDNGEWKQVFRIRGLMCKKEVFTRQACSWLKKARPI